MKKLFILITLFICFSALAGCNNTSDEESCQHNWGEWQFNDEVHWRDYTCGHDSPEVAGEHTWDDGVEVEGGNGGHVMEYTCTVCGKKYQETIIIIPTTSNLEFAIEDKTNELVKYKTSILANINSSELSNSVAALFDKCVADIKNAENIFVLNELSNKCLKDVYDLIPLANGVFDFSNLNDNDKKEILSLLDDYIFRNNLGGIPISQYYTLNLNSTTKEQWNEFFGEEGSICQTSKNEYWDVKEFLSNEYFLKGLCLALPKEEMSNETSIFQQIDYSKYEFYNYDLNLARKYFAVAMEELSPIYASSSQYPIEIKLEIAFGTKTEKKEQLFETLKNNIETAFNDPSVSNGDFVLTVDVWYEESIGQIYVEKNYNGKFDLSYEKISLSSYDQYMYYNLLSTNYDLSHGLTINWSIDTNNIEDDCIVYNGYRFTYDLLLALLSSKTNVAVEGAHQTRCKVYHSYNDGIYVAPEEPTPGDEGYMLYTCNVCGYEEIASLPQVFSFSITFGFDGYYNSATGELKNGFNHDLDVECKTILSLTEEELFQIYGLFYLGNILNNQENIWASEDLWEPSYTIGISYSINYVEYRFNIYGASFIELDEWEEGYDIGYAYYKVLNDYILSSKEFKNLPPNTRVYE